MSSNGGVISDGTLEPMKKSQNRFPFRKVYQDAAICRSDRPFGCYTIIFWFLSQRHQGPWETAGWSTTRGVKLVAIQSRVEVQRMFRNVHCLRLGGSISWRRSQRTRCGGRNREVPFLAKGKADFVFPEAVLCVKYRCRMVDSCIDNLGSYGCLQAVIHLHPR